MQHFRLRRLWYQMNMKRDYFNTILPINIRRLISPGKGSHYLKVLYMASGDRHLPETFSAILCKGKVISKTRSFGLPWHMGSS